MTESEARTRKERIDARLRSSVLGWTLIRSDEVRDCSLLTRHAVEEYPTETGPADYALFVEGKLLGIIEAKKVSLGAENVLEQAKRYARGVPDTVGDWRGYRVPSSIPPTESPSSISTCAEKKTHPGCWPISTPPGPCSKNTAKTRKVPNDGLLKGPSPK